MAKNIRKKDRLDPGFEPQDRWHAGLEFEARNSGFKAPLA